MRGRRWRGRTWPTPRAATSTCCWGRSRSRSRCARWPRGVRARAARLLEPWLDVIGDRLRLEVVHHRRPGPGRVRLAARTLALAIEHGVSAVLANAVRYADPGMGEVADVLDAARLLVPIDPRKPDRLEGWLRHDPRRAADL